MAALARMLPQSVSRNDARATSLGWPRAPFASRVATFTTEPVAKVSVTATEPICRTEAFRLPSAGRITSPF